MNPGGLLFRVLSWPDDDGSAVDDFFGVRRGVVAMIGALERAGGAISWR